MKLEMNSEKAANDIERVADMVRKNFVDDGSEVLHGVVADGRDGTEKTGSIPVERLLFKK